MVKCSEWSFKSLNSIHTGNVGVVWLVNMSDKLLKARASFDFFQSSTNLDMVSWLKGV